MFLAAVPSARIASPQTPPAPTISVGVKRWIRFSEAYLTRRQSGEQRVRERHRNAVGSEGDAGNGVVRQLLRLIARKPLRGRKGRAPAGDRTCVRGCAGGSGLFGHAFVSLVKGEPGCEKRDVSSRLRVVNLVSRIP